MTLKDMLEKRANLVEQARAIQAAAESDGRDLTAEELQNFDQYVSEAEDIKEQVDARQREESLSTRLGQIEEDLEERATFSGPVTQPDRISETATLSAGGEDRAARQERAFGDFLRLKPWEYNAEQRALQADLATTGGYTVAPPQFFARLIEAVKDQVLFRQLGTVFTVNSTESVQFPRLTTRPDDADWTSEIGTITADSSMAFGLTEITPHKLTKSILVSEKLLEISSLPVESIIRDQLSYKLAVPQENGFMTGSGSGQPLGVFTAHADGISTGRDVSTDNTTTEFTFDGLKRAKYSLKDQYRDRAQWLFHRDAINLLSRLKDGEGQYQWEASTQVGAPDRLLGNAVRTSEYVPNTFTTGLYVGAIGDWSHYYIVERDAVGFKRFEERLGAVDLGDTSQIGFRVQSWTGGAHVLEESVARVTLA